MKCLEKALYTSRIDDYKKKGTVVPMWIQSGDHDLWESLFQLPTSVGS